MGALGALVALTLGTVGCGKDQPADQTASPSSAEETTSPTPTEETTSPTPTEEVTTETPTPPVDAIVLNVNGIGPFEFGAPRADVAAYLTAALGSPITDTERDGVGECEGGYGQWQANEIYGVLTVEYDGADDSPTSPQALAAWSVSPIGEPPAPLAFTDNIPWSMSWEELQARYPDGGGLEHMGTWFVDGVAIHPAEPEDEFGGMVFAGRINWCI